MNISDERGSGRLYCKILESIAQDFTNKIEAVICAPEAAQQSLNARFTGFRDRLTCSISSTNILQMWVVTPLALANISI